MQGLAVNLWVLCNQSGIFFKSLPGRDPTPIRPSQALLLVYNLAQWCNPYVEAPTSATSWETGGCSVAGLCLNSLIFFWICSALGPYIPPGTLSRPRVSAKLNKLSLCLSDVWVLGFAKHQLDAHCSLQHWFWS